LTFNRLHGVIIIIIIIIIIILTANGFSPGGSGTTIRHITQITYITQNNNDQTKHSTQNYTHSKHRTQNENTIITTTHNRIPLYYITPETWNIRKLCKCSIKERGQ
jgi:hypothetical protein